MLLLACWGVRRLARWILYAPEGVTVVLPSSECMVLAEDRTVHPRLRAVVIELGMYGVSFAVDRQREADGSWLASFLAREAVATHLPEEEPEPIPHVPTTV